MKADFRAALLALLYLSACDGGGDDTGGDDTGGDDSGDTGGSGTLITASTGGTVTSPDGLMTLDIPAGALASDTRITIDIVPQAEWSNTQIYTLPITAVYALGPSGTTFSSPAVATFDLDATAVERLSETILDPFEPPRDVWVAPEGYLQDSGDAEGLEITTTLALNGTGSVEVEVPHFSDVWISERALNALDAFQVEIADPYARWVDQIWMVRLVVGTMASLQVQVEAKASPPLELLSADETGWASATLVATGPGPVPWSTPIKCSQEGTEKVLYYARRVPQGGGHSSSFGFYGPPIECVAPPAATCTPTRALDPSGWTVLHQTDAAADPMQSTLEAFNGCQAVVTETVGTTTQVLIDTSPWGARRVDDYVVVSTDTEGAGTGDSYDAVLSADGRRGVFLTQADDLLGQTVGTEAAIVFSVDPDDGLPTLERFARTPATHRETYPAISADGRWVAFNDHTSNTYLLDADTPSSTAVGIGSGLFPVVDRWGGNVAVSYYYNDGGTFPYQIEVIDVDPDRDGESVVEQGVGSGTRHRITRSTTGDYCNGTQVNTRTLGLSETGRFVLYSSDATDLTTDVVPAEPHIFLHDRDADDDWVYDEIGGTSTEIVSRLPNGTIVSSPSVTGQRWLSDDGRYAVFQTYDLSGTGGAHSQVYVRDLVNDATALVTATSGGAPANGNSFSPFLSPDGSTIALVTTATDLPGVPAPSPSVAVVGPNPLYEAP